ncbi:hypothetical protein HPB52_017279 [Rhipicephalus sanguineus]|uniref:Uncharacterized protein n=1 Tax=Rhipicephalus sanguineus TaxID=34632 RepID=A0A9D4STH6_RHISA|nr:hypothetical protein HPB52_017279 [Rhipicephalus sanguineus]
MFAESLSRSSLAAATQTDEETSGSDDECYWDDDDDDLSGDEPTVIIRLDPRPEEEEERTTWQNLGQWRAREDVQEAVSTVDPYGQEYNSEAAASGSGVQLVPVMSYLCFPVVMYQPCTVETTSPTDLPVESSQPYDTATQELTKEDHWEVVSQWTTEFTTDFNVTSPQLYNQSPLLEDVEKRQDWDAKFPSQHSEATQTPFGAVTSEWHAAKAWERDGPQGSQLNAAAANRTGRRTMADVVRSSPAPAQPPVASSSPQPLAPVVASYQAAAGDQVQVTPEEGTWETASFLQSAWTVAAGTAGCVFYESNRHTR